MEVIISWIGRGARMVMGASVCGCVFPGLDLERIHSGANQRPNVPVLAPSRSDWSAFSLNVSCIN